MTALLFLALIFIACSWYVTIRQRDAWPFTAYPMFSRVFRPETLRVYRIALEYDDGSSRWWRPHYYKLQQTLGKEFSRAISSPEPDRMLSVGRIILKIEYCLEQDPGIAGATKYCVVLRRPVAAPDGTWQRIDEVVWRGSLQATEGAQ